MHTPMCAYTCMYLYIDVLIVCEHVTHMLLSYRITSHYMRLPYMPFDHIILHYGIACIIIIIIIIIIIRCSYD